MFTDEPDLERLRKAYDLRGRNPEIAMAEFKALAEIGSVMSLAYLGEAFETGNGAEKDFTKSEYWYEKAYEKGYVKGIFSLAKQQFSGKNYAKAEELFKKCVQKDYLPSFFWLAHLYIKNPNEDYRSIDKAIDLLEIGASRGHVFAKRQLAGLLIKGHSGFKGRFRGFWLFFEAAVTGPLIFLKDPKSELLK